MSPPQRPLDVDALVLEAGAHDTGQGMCVMEAVAWIAGERWTDRPKCASPVVAALLRELNDRWDDQSRQLLKTFIPRVIGSVASVGVERARRWLMVDWLARTAAVMMTDPLVMRADLEPDVARTVSHVHAALLQMSEITSASGAISHANLEPLLRIMRRLRDRHTSLRPSVRDRCGTAGIAPVYDALDALPHNRSTVPVAQTAAEIAYAGMQIANIDEWVPGMMRASVLALVDRMLNQE